MMSLIATEPIMRYLPDLFTFYRGYGASLEDVLVAMEPLIMDRKLFRWNDRLFLSKRAMDRHKNAVHDAGARWLGAIRIHPGKDTICRHLPNSPLSQPI
jgi:hypothetical protein